MLHCRRSLRSDLCALAGVGHSGRQLRFLNGFLQYQAVTCPTGQGGGHATNTLIERPGLCVSVVQDARKGHCLAAPVSEPDVAWSNRRFYAGSWPYCCRCRSARGAVDGKRGSRSDGYTRNTTASTRPRPSADGDCDCWRPRPANRSAELGDYKSGWRAASRPLDHSCRFGRRT